MRSTMETFKQEPTDKLEFLFDLSTPEPNDDFQLIKLIVAELKLNGLFDQLRKVCLANIEAKASYANFRQRVETTVAQRLGITKWTSDMDTNVLRQQLKKHLTLDLKMVDEEFDALVDEVFTADLINQTKEAVLEKLKSIFKCHEVQKSGTESPSESTVPTTVCDNGENENSDNSTPMDLDGIPLPQTPPPEQQYNHSDIETIIQSEQNECHSKMDEEKDGVETSREHSKDRKSSDKKHEYHSDPHSSSKSKSLDKTLSVEQEWKNSQPEKYGVKISPSDSRHLTDKESDSKDKGDKESTKSSLSAGSTNDQARMCALNNPTDSNQVSESSQSSSGSDKSKQTSKSWKNHNAKGKSKSHSSKTSHHSKSYHHKSHHSYKSEVRKVVTPKKSEELKVQKLGHESRENKMRNETSLEVVDKNLSEPEDELLYFEESEVDVKLEFANTLVRKLEEDDTWSQISSVSTNSADLSGLDNSDITVDIEEIDWPKFSTILGEGAVFPSDQMYRVDDSQLQLQGKATESQVQGPIGSAD